MRKIFALILGAALFASCATKETPKTLVLYYSQTGSTQAVAEQLQKMLGADIEAFDVVEAYDGDYNATIQRSNEERANGVVPTLVPIKSDLSKYDTIFIGYPIWFGTYALPVRALLNSVDLAGKKVVPFCTFGSGGLEKSSADLKNALPQSEVAEGFGIRSARVQYVEEELNTFLVANGYIEGEYEPLPEYSEQHEVIPEEVYIFEEATSDYQMPLGEPVTVGARMVPNIEGAVDFVYTAKTTSADGTESFSKVYVQRRNGRKAEFTKVVR